MPFWGWIPILTDKLLYQSMIEKFFEEKDKTLSESEIPSILQTKIANVHIEQYTVYKKPIIFHKSPSFCFFVTYNSKPDQGREKKLKIIAGKNEKTGNIGWICDLIDVNDKGLVCFNVETFDDVQELSYGQIVTHCFILIRDIFHKHIYAEKSDMTLLHEKADNSTEAIDKISNQYREKVVEYHQAIKKRLNLSEGVWWNYDLNLNYLDDCKDAIGEMIHYQAFCKLFNRANEEQHIIYIISSFSNLREHLNSLSSSKSLLINLALAILTALGLSIILNNLLSLLNLKKSTSMIISILLAFLLVGILFYYLKLKRKHRDLSIKKIHKYIISSLTKLFSKLSSSY